MKYIFEVNKKIKNCGDCPISNPGGCHNYKCDLTKLYMSLYVGAKIPKWCPLIEVEED